MTTHSQEPLKLFYCYAHEDKTLRDELDVHLSGMKRLNLIQVWYDREILAGTNWEQEIDKHLGTADIVLLLVSARFLASDYCYGIEMQKALQRDAAGTARVVPILLRPVDWEDAPFSHLQILPTGAKPVTRWNDHNDAFEDVAKELRKVVRALQARAKTKEEWFDEAYALNELGNYNEALISCNYAIQLDHNYALAYHEKSYTLNELKRYNEALVACDRAIQLNPNYASTYNVKGSTLRNLKRFDEALIVYEQVNQLDPNDAVAYYNKGYVLNELGRHDEALVACDQSLQLKSDYAPAHNEKGYTLDELGRYDEALVAYNQAIQLNPDYVTAYNNRGTALKNLKRYNEALVAYNQAIQLNPNYALAYFNKGVTLENLNRNEEAQVAFAKAKELGYSEKAML